jgi:hypothetical protein
LSQYPAQVLNETERTIKLTWGHPAIYGTPYEESDLPFSNRVFLYIDLNVPDADKDGLITAAADRRIVSKFETKLIQTTSRLMKPHGRSLAMIPETKNRS